MSPERVVKYLTDTIPVGEHSPSMVRVRLDVVEGALEHIDWLEKGIAEWRGVALIQTKQAKAARATARIAIKHLQAMLAPPRTYAEQQSADNAARDWLASIESDA